MKEKCSKEKGKMKELGKRCLRSGKKYGIIKNAIGRCAMTSRNTMWRTSNDTREERL